jgi:dynactin complex subunit
MSDELEEDYALDVGATVFVNNKHKGIVRFLGPVDFAAVEYAGVELEVPGAGDCDGTFGGREYFKCKPKCGMLVTLDKVSCMLLLMSCMHSCN